MVQAPTADEPIAFVQALVIGYPWQTHTRYFVFCFSQHLLLGGALPGGLMTGTVWSESPTHSPSASPSQQQVIFPLVTGMTVYHLSSFLYCFPSRLREWCDRRDWPGSTAVALSSKMKKKTTVCFPISGSRPFLFFFV